MDTLKIRSHLPNFRLIERISVISPKGMGAVATFNNAPPYAGVEAMAQTAALHVRHCLRFQRHAFLLSVQRCRMPQLDLLEGCFRVTADLHSQSSKAFLYRVVAKGPDGVTFDGELLIGTRDYDDRFREAVLAAHYRTLMAELEEI